MQEEVMQVVDLQEEVMQVDLLEDLQVVVMRVVVMQVEDYLVNSDYLVN